MAIAASHQEMSDQQRHENMLFMQMEALHPSRRDRISTIDYKEQKKDFVPMRQISRRADRAGTEENLAVQGARKQLTAWNNAWKDLEDDGTAADLKDVNEGLGQTHRGKLQADETVKHYVPEEVYYFRQARRSGHGVQGGQSGIRGGGFAGRGDRRVGRSARVAKSRVVKGNASPTSIIATQETYPQDKSCVRAASSMSSKRRTTEYGDVSGTRHASKSAFVRRPTPKPGEHSGRESSRESTTYNGQLATPNDFMASIQSKPTLQVPNAANQPDIQIPTNGANQISDISQVKTPSPERSSAQTDLMDIDVGQEVPHQPVIGFTHPADSTTKTKAQKDTVAATGSTNNNLSSFADIEKFIENIGKARAAGLLEDYQLKTLQNIVHELETRANAEAVKAKVRDKPTKYTRAEILALRPKTESPPSKVVAASPKPPPNRREEPTKVLSDANNLRSAYASPNQEENLLAGQRELIVGEHVHRTRFQPAQLTEKFGEMSLVDNAPSKPASSTQPRSGPSLPAHLANLPPITDHGAAMRAQYGVTNRPSLKSFKTGPTLPAHLANRPPVKDQGAAARAQYGS